MLTDFQTTFTAARTNQTRLPEHLLPRWSATLAAGDVATVLFISLVVLAGASNSVIAAIVTTVLICCAFWACGLYKNSYAVYARDEAYYACTAVLAATIPTFLIVGGIGQIDALLLFVSLLFSALATSAWHVGMHMQRRSTSAPSASRTTITPAAWHARESLSYLLAKRCFDIAVAFAAVLLTSPIMCAAALAIVFESGEPVLFKQERVGRDGTRFDVFKFRTLVRDSSDDWVRPGDARITRVGAFLRRTSIDELPQLFNVLAGSMSIVGPRPEMVEFADRFSHELPAYHQRHIVAPGITGWAQVYGKRNMAPDEVKDILPYDLFYVERASVVLDSAILLKTITEVLFHRAI